MRMLALFGLAAGLLFLSEPAHAQMTREHDIAAVRSFHGGATRIRRSFASDVEARTVFRQILAAAGLDGMEDRIIVRASAETANAEATIEKKPDGTDERLIFYNAVFMADIATKSQNYWAKVAILAHEVGHHVRFHTMIAGRDHEFELEADYQAGFILRRMGATLAEAQSAFRTIEPEQATKTHPGRSQRLQSVTIGWTNAGAGAPPEARVPVAAAPPPEAATATVSAAAEAWAHVDKRSAAQLEAFEKRFRDTYYGDLARLELDGLKKVEAEQQRVALLEQKKKDDAEIEALRKADEAATLSATAKGAEQERHRIQMNNDAADATKPGRVFRDCADVCPEMVVIPPGSFLMGSMGSAFERPLHKVEIRKAFAVAKFTVTFAE